MPSTSYRVGGSLLPREAEGANSPYRDPVLDGLLSFFAHYVRTAVGAKVSEQQGPTSSARLDDACPEDNLFPFNHQSTFMRPHRRAGLPPEALPGMWLWVEGGEDTQEGATLWSRHVAAWTLRLDYVFPELQVPDGIAGRSGLLGDVGRALHKAAAQKSHPTFTPEGGALGSAVLRPLSLMGIALQRWSVAPLAGKPSTSAVGNGRSAAEGAAQRFFPAVSATLRAWARVGAWEPSSPEDVLQDSFLTISTGDNTADMVEVLERVIPAPIETAGD